jgi:hypothetical protein
MFCEHCGNKLEADAQFCHNCGKQVSGISTGAVFSVVEFYSEDWRRKSAFGVGPRKYFDIILDKDFLYIIRIPSYSGRLWGFIFGLLLLNIIGAAIGSSWGDSSDTKKRKWYRSAWIQDGQVITNDFVQDIFLKVPVESLKQNLLLGENSFTLSQGDKTIVLKKWHKEFERFHHVIKKYVL